MPEAATWKYVENQFDAATRESRIAANQLIQDHDAKLKAESEKPGADPRLADLLSSFKAFKQGWEKEYSEWKNMEASYEGGTVSLETLLTQLVTKPSTEEASKIEDWDTRIRVVTPKGSALYTTLLPQGREPFSGAKKDQIIQAVKDLGTRLSDQTAKPALVTLGTEVTAFYDLLKTARETQKGFEGETDTESADLSPARTAVMQAMYGNLGMLMHIFQENPIMITGFFDLDLLRKPEKQKAIPPTP